MCAGAQKWSILVRKSIFSSFCRKAKKQKPVGHQSSSLEMHKALIQRLSVLIAVALQSISLCTFGQNERGSIPIDTTALALSKITISDGLSQGMVSTIEQDRHGFMWFGTKDGLNRYDGYQFKVFRHDAADSNSVRESTITGLYCDKHGRMWVGTATGLDLFDERTERFIHVPVRHPKGDWGSVVHIVMDDNDDLWVSTTWILVKLTFNESFDDYRIPSFTTTWYGNGYATIGRTRDGRLWGNFDENTFCIEPKHLEPDIVDTIGVFDDYKVQDQFGALTVVEDTIRNKILGIYKNGIVEINPVTREITYLIQDTSDRNWLQALNPIIDRKGIMWLSTFRGLYRFDPNLRQMTYIRPSDPDMKTLMSSLKYTFIDATGTLWLGTSGYGLLKYDSHKERFNNVQSSSVRALSVTKDNNLLISCYDNFITQYDPSQQRKILHIAEVSQKWPAIGSTLLTQYADMTVQDRDGVFWSFINYGTLSHYNAQTGEFGLLRPEISPGEIDGGFHFPLHIGIDGSLWCGGDKALWRIDTRSKQCTPYPWTVPVVNNPYPFVTALHQGKDGILWIGTVKGLLRFDPATNKWNNYEHDRNDSTSLSTPTVFSICPDPSNPTGILWIGTNGGGLNKFNTQTGRFQRYMTKDGLPNDVVYGVLHDDMGYIWMSTNKGLSQFDPKTGHFRNFNAGDGLQSDEFNRHAYAKDSKGWLYFGGVAGFNYFNPLALRQDSTPVKVRITGIRLINKPVEFGVPGSPLTLPVHLSSSIEVPYSANMVTFSFAAMEYAAPELHEYRYMLEGFDEDWIDAGKANIAVYTNLDPGSYTFRVRGRNRDGIWDEKGTSFELTVLPPWWRTWWFYMLCGLVIVGGTLLYIRSLRIQKVVLERTVNDRTRELSREKDKTDELLKNILPENVADELKIRGTAEARHFDQVTILFSDFKDFTIISEQLSAAELVEELNVCFNAFDRIMEKYGIEKIKTIGDSYMAAGGVPDPTSGTPHAVVLAALEMQHSMNERQDERRQKGKPAFEMRVGIHTGPVVAGIVGRRKFQYDIWGDAVNIASRMESTCESGQVNLSSATYQLVKDSPDLVFTPRGKVTTKGKGELEMFYVHARSIETIIESEPTPKEPKLKHEAPSVNVSTSDKRVQPATARLSDLSILLAEDNDFNAMVAQGHLEDWVPGVQLTHVRNGALAVEALINGQFDVVLMDIQMPEMNGYDATKAIRALNGPKSAIPIIAMSANVMKAEMDRCMEAGMNAFVPKPYKKEQLLDAIEKAVKKNQGTS
jgi:class 3 adenylate cyclase/ligand-binding sensor domain-containing protein